MFTMPSLTTADRQRGAAVVELVTRGGYHLGVVAGLTAVLCLLIFAAGFQRWAGTAAQASLAARVVPLALTYSAGAYGTAASTAALLSPQIRAPHQ